MARRAARLAGKPRLRRHRRRTTPEALPNDDQADDEERGPLRRCVVTREHGERAAMVRFVLGPDRLIVPDLAARLPGRGFWLSARADVLNTAMSRGAFARAARSPVTFPPDLAGLIQKGLTRRVVDTLGLARRAGQAVSGFTKAREVLTAGRARLVVQAFDGSEEECHRLLSGARDVPAVRPLSAASLGGVFGRDHVVHVAVTPGRLAEALAADAGRLAGFPAAGPGIADDKTGMAPSSRRVRIERTGE